MALTFYFDFISPYAYLAWLRIHDVAARHDETVAPVPILFAALLGAHGHKGPAEIPSKRVYTFKHVVRLADELGVPLRPPPAHPFVPLLGLRVATAATDPPTRRRVVDALYAATWARGVGIDRPETIREALDDAGLPGAELLEAAGTAPIKLALREATDQALARGVFGVPTIFAGEEMFWGQDSLGHLERHLEGDDPAADDRIAPWADLPVGVRRPGS